MAQLRVSYEATPFDQQLLDAKLKRLGVELDEDRHISKIKEPSRLVGGFHALDAAADHYGCHRAVLTLEGASKLQLTPPASYGERLKTSFGRDEVARGARTISNAISLMGAASEQVKGLKPNDTAALVAALKSSTVASQLFLRATEEMTLGCALPGDNVRLKAAYRGFLDGLRQIRSHLQYDPFIRQLPGILALLGFGDHQPPATVVRAFKESGEALLVAMRDFDTLLAAVAQKERDFRPHYRELVIKFVELGHMETVPMTDAEKSALFLVASWMLQQLFTNKYRTDTELLTALSKAHADACQSGKLHEVSCFASGAFAALISRRGWHPSGNFVFPKEGETVVDPTISVLQQQVAALFVANATTTDPALKKAIQAKLQQLGETKEAPTHPGL